MCPLPLASLSLSLGKRWWQYEHAAKWTWLLWALARKRRNLAAVAALTSLPLSFLVEQVPFLPAAHCSLADIPPGYKPSNCAHTTLLLHLSQSLSLFSQHLSSFAAAVSRPPKSPMQVHSFPITLGDYCHLLPYRALQQGTGHLQDISQ